ncbi:regulatory protein, luxR family [Antarctobacter heliothermus]|uniref:Regulatory protein, luxR family n=2 Tax=Antarctobacter heliothermus TaxID=74033 RepID=A0A239KXN2_9RHOB|nr:regulatory protein, luxR family [Antarctobacter heliothermus]
MIRAGGSGGARAILLCLLMSCLCAVPTRAQDIERPIVRVGVLAHRGWNAGETQWSLLATYLQGALPAHVVRFVPVTLTSAGPLINAGGLDFLITNPGHYIDLADSYPMSVLATRKRTLPDGAHTLQFGSAVLVRADSGLTTFADLRGARVGAVAPQAFGGFQLTWFEARAQGVDLFDDPADLAFYGFPQDTIVADVLAGKLDAGIVRSGLLERLIIEGTVPRDALRALNANVTYTHPEAVSTRLYPEWPFLALAGTDAAMRDAVALALLQSADSGLPDPWGAPVSYHEARALVAAYAGRSSPATEVGNPGSALVLWLLVGAAGVLGLGGGLFFVRARRGDPTSGAKPPRDQDAVSLTRRETQVLAQIGAGKSTKEIAAQLGISPKTVEFHRANLLRKFEARSSAQLIARAGQQGTEAIPET